MSRTIMEVSDELIEALKGVDLPGGGRLRAGPIDGRDVNPPQAMVGPPQMFWEGYCGPASRLSFAVTLIVKPDGLALERLYKLVPLVSQALDSVPGASVTTAFPSSWGATSALGVDGFPAYTLTIEVSP